MIKAIFFDLDGTLLPLNDKVFAKKYFSLLCTRMVKFGYEPNELLNVILEGTNLMYKNDGTYTNEKVFWNYVNKHYKENKEKDIPLFDEFYITEFKDTKSCCEDNIYAKDIIKFIKSKGLKVVLSTNPLFPKSGITTRLSFIGLNDDDFDYITTYDNSHFTKPNPKYFTEILTNLNLNPNEVIMFGNNEYEDGYASMIAGISKCYMVGNYIIKDEKHNIKLPHISIENIINTIDNEIKNTSN